MTTNETTVWDVLEALNLLTAADVSPCRLEDVQALLFATGPQARVVDAFYDVALASDGRSMASLILAARRAAHPYLEAEIARVCAPLIGRRERGL